MIPVEPKVFLIGETTLLWDNVKSWLEHVGGTPCLDYMYGHDAEQLVELAGKECYRSFCVGINPNVTKVTEDSAKYHANYMKQGHGALLEHAQLNFAFEDVSRVFTHELVRHRAGCAYSQVSLRYCRLDNLRFWIPPDIQADEQALELFTGTVATLEDAQRKLAAIFKVDELPFADKKRLTSAFRRIAPIGLATGIVASFNMRALRHIIFLRTAKHAEVEMRIAFGKVFDIVKERYPLFFADAEYNEDREVIFQNEKV